MQLSTPLKKIIFSGIRYCLGIVMIAYGILKVTQIQFQLPPEIQTYPLSELNGVTIAWIFLGFSKTLSFILGLMELIPGFLLLFRKTQTLGAILLLPAMVGVFITNLAFDFLPHMKIFTGALLLSNLTLLYPRRALLYAFFESLINREHPINLKEAALNILICIAVCMAMFLYLE